MTSPVRQPSIIAPIFLPCRVPTLLRRIKDVIRRKNRDARCWSGNASVRTLGAIWGVGFLRLIGVRHVEWGSDGNISPPTRLVMPYLERAMKALRDSGMEVDDNLLPHMSPLGWEHISLTGDYVWPQSRQVGPGKFRPLRTRNEAKRTIFPFREQTPMCQRTDGKGLERPPLVRESRWLGVLPRHGPVPGSREGSTYDIRCCPSVHKA